MAHGYSDDDAALALSSGYDYHDDDHDVHGGHSASGYGKKEECCPLVVDLLCLAAILFAIAGAAFFLMRVIQIELTMVPANPGRRKRRRSLGVRHDDRWYLDLVIAGRLKMRRIVGTIYPCFFKSHWTEGDPFLKGYGCRPNTLATLHSISAYIFPPRAPSPALPNIWRVQLSGGVSPSRVGE